MSSKIIGLVKYFFKLHPDDLFSQRRIRPAGKKILHRENAAQRPDGEHEDRHPVNDRRHMMLGTGFPARFIWSEGCRPDLFFHGPSFFGPVSDNREGIPVSA